MTLTRERIMAIPVGLELDEAIAKHVMGWKMRGSHSICAWRPSHSIADAWMMEEHIAISQGRHVWRRYGMVLAELIGKPDENQPPNMRSLHCQPWDLAHASPEMRCRAALLTLMQRRSEGL